MGFIKKKMKMLPHDQSSHLPWVKMCFFFNYDYVRGLYPHKTNFLGKKMK